ncbi:MAG TPA: right-handed parallel beta-helix repeat-containing protein, partial [Candidatus Polarisedimenticolia bacterium]|nr:right-handed parallel beta-helix repeat-containing protein [Candidatus Polarisedimenticolia bacterium]
MTRGRTVLCLILCLAAGGAAGWGAIWYVDDNTCPAIGTGTLGNPYCSIQTAIDLAQPGDTVRVAEGRYTAKLTRPLTTQAPVLPNPATAIVFMRDQVHLEGAGAGKSILDAGGQDRVAILENVGAGTRFQGFTVTGGDTTSRVGDGGGLLILYGAPVITHNTIMGNRAFYGGGMEVLYAAPEIQDNVITGNAAGNDLESGTGGGIDVAFECSPVITHNLITGNYVHGSGGGLALYETDAVVESNRIEGNVAELHGGGVFSAPTANGVTSAADLLGNVISMNVARSGHGGGVFASEDTGMELNTISHNRAMLGDGGGVLTLGPKGISLSDNIIDHNGAVSGGGVFFDPTSSPAVTGNDVVANLPAEFGGALDPSGTQGNESVDPLMINVPDFVADVQVDRFSNLVVATDGEPTRQFALGDVVEYGDDGIPRIVTQIKTAVGVPLIKLVTDPWITENDIVPHPVVLRRWGANPSIRENFGVRANSPIVDATGNGTKAPTL